MVDNRQWLKSMLLDIGIIKGSTMSLVSQMTGIEEKAMMSEHEYAKAMACLDQAETALIQLHQLIKDISVSNNAR